MELVSWEDAFAPVLDNPRLAFGSPRARPSTANLGAVSAFGASSGLGASAFGASSRQSLGVSRAVGSVRPSTASFGLPSFGTDTTLSHGAPLTPNGGRYRGEGGGGGGDGTPRGASHLPASHGGRYRGEGADGRYRGENGLRPTTAPVGAAGVAMRLATLDFHAHAEGACGFVPSAAAVAPHAPHLATLAPPTLSQLSAAGRAEPRAPQPHLLSHLLAHPAPLSPSQHSVARALCKRVERGDALRAPELLLLRRAATEEWSRFASPTLLY